MDLAGVLETVLYCSTENEDETRRFYRDLLGLKPFQEDSIGHRVGPGVFLLFNRDESSVQDWPPPHGAVGPSHACFRAAPGDYDRWRDELSAKGVEILDETEWDAGLRSFYFEDPAGNVLEIAEDDIWPRERVV
jgi:catechol 2,3-dioxygenase-like lactoylglutathione lyase family enzyme